jgi:hypothetical protein
MHANERSVSTVNLLTFPCRRSLADDDAIDGAVPEDPAGGAAGVPAVPGAGDQVPVGAALQDVDRRQVAVSAGAAVGAVRHALPPVRGAAHHRLPPGLHLRQARRHAPPRGRAGPRHLRVLARARRRARLPRRRRRPLPRGVHAPRGRRHRRRPHPRRLGGGAQAWAPPSMIGLVHSCKMSRGPVQNRPDPAMLRDGLSVQSIGGVVGSSRFYLLYFAISIFIFFLFSHTYTVNYYTHESK